MGLAAEVVTDCSALLKDRLEQNRSILCNVVVSVSPRASEDYLPGVCDAYGELAALSLLESPLSTTAWGAELEQLLHCCSTPAECVVFTP